MWKPGLQDPTDFAKTRRLCRLRYAKDAQPLCELPEPRKMDHILVAVRAENKMANVGIVVFASMDALLYAP
jgi:hypothetical protein